VTTDTAPAGTVGAPPPDARPDPLAPFDAFMRTVAQACSTPGGRAALADGLATDLSQAPFQLYHHLLEHQPDGRIPGTWDDPQRERPYLLVACLYAFHDAPNPRMTGGRRPKPPRFGHRWHNLGWSYQQATAGAMRPKTAADTLIALAGLDLDGLYRDLPGAISLLRSQRVPVTWSVLLRDLTRWPEHADSIRLSWIRSFHAAPTTKENTK
jgi:CRISPR type I-E-associated protein CasB/Cse2